MNMKNFIHRITAQEDLNFLLTNRIPRMTLTRFMGWWSQIKNPWIRDASIAVWKLFSDLDLSDAQKTHFESMHDCFTRELKPGARTIDLRVITGQRRAQAAGVAQLLRLRGAVVLQQLGVAQRDDAAALVHAGHACQVPGAEKALLRALHLHLRGGGRARVSAARDARRQSAASTRASASRFTHGGRPEERRPMAPAPHPAP